MSYIGNPIVSQAFLTDQFSGTGSATAFTLSVAPASSASILVTVSGVLQDPSTYGVAGTTLTFSAAPPSGTGNISVRYLGIPSTGVTSTAYRTVTEITATAGQTTFTPASYNVGFLNVYQNGSLLGSADYTASNGTTVVLATGATVGDLLLFESFNVSSVLNAIPATPGAVSPSYLAAAGASKAFLDVVNGNGTGALRIPSGTTAQRPVSPVAGDTRYNTTTTAFESYNGSNWIALLPVSSYSASYLLVAGGAGGAAIFGGGGAGGLLTGTTTLNSGTTYSFVVGAGGARTGSYGSSPINGNSGNNSTAFGLTAIGGGYGGAQAAGAGGGSGGGGGGWAATPYSGGSGTSGQGNNGGTGSNADAGGGGGGGAGAVGSNGTSAGGGAGGNGVTSSITGISTYYAGGGGGGSYTGTYTSATGGSGGLGGGGAGGLSSGSGGYGNGNDGTANTGGGGGGGTRQSQSVYGGAGGSGVLILSMPSALYTGTTTGSPTVTTSGSNTILTFTASGSYTA